MLPEQVYLSGSAGRKSGKNGQRLTLLTDYVLHYGRNNDNAKSNAH